MTSLAATHASRPLRATRRGFVLRALLSAALLTALVPAEAVEAKTSTFSGTVSKPGTRSREHSFSVGRPGTIRATLKWDTSVDLNLFLYDPSGRIVAAAQSISAKPETLSYEATTAGTWKLLVRLVVSGSAAYSLTVDYPAAFSGSVSAAGTSSRSHPLSVSRPGTISATLSWSSTADLNLLLYDPSGTLAAAAQSTTAKPETIAHAATVSGTWTLTVQAASGSASYTLKVSFAAAPAPSGSSVVDAAADAGVYEIAQSYSADVGDFDTDGWPDVFMGLHYMHRPRLYRNDGGTFTEVNPGSFPKNDRHNCTWGDVNQDGLPDFYCTLGADHGWGFKENELWIQQPDRTFVNQAAAYGVTDDAGRGRDTAFLDVNHDPYPDLFVGNTYPRKDGIPSPNRLFINAAGAHFVHSPEYGLNAEVGAWCVRPADFDADGWTDLLVCGNNRLYLYRNNLGTSFTDVSAALGVSGYASDAAFADLDGDGTLDIVNVRAAALEVRLQRDGSFMEPLAIRTLVTGRALATGDVNGDARPDLYVLQGCNGSGVDQRDRVLVNDGSGVVFSDVDLPQPGSGCGDAVASIDYDRDGATDFIVLNGALKTQGPVQLIRFPTPTDPG